QDEQAYDHLEAIADGFLIHDRPIHMRTDDSVVRAAFGREYIARRSRGYAPDAIPLPFDVQPVLAAGPELKNTFTLARDRYAFMSHHIGDMENFETLQSFESGIGHFERLFKVTPRVIACDLHPNYLASRYAEQRACEENLPLVKVQHHHAHLAACLADNSWPIDGPGVIGVILDGTGLGADGSIWGGEVLIGGYQGYQRRLHLQNMPLPGGDAAIRHPARTSLAYLWKAGLDVSANLPPVLSLPPAERQILLHQLEQNINTMPTSSVGRLFDAVSSLIGVCHNAGYEGQAAIELENIADAAETGCYDFPTQENEILLAPVLRAVVEDVKNNLPAGVISARFHNGITEMILRVCDQIRQESDINTVALSGGVW
ncbi:MAG: hypothetical protein AAGU05_15350, partial [Anaerolineaceae bacterium]